MRLLIETRDARKARKSWLSVLNHPGHDQKSHGRKGHTGDRMSAKEYEQAYGTSDGYESSEFSSMADGAGEVRAFPGENVQIAFTHDDGSVSVFRDLSADEAAEIGESVGWASAKDISPDSFGDRGPDPDNGLLAWAEHKGTDTLVGVRPDGGVSLVTKGDADHRVDLPPGKSDGLENALYEAADIASE